MTCKGLCFLVLFILLPMPNVFTNETKLQFYFAEVALKIPEEHGRKSVRPNDPSFVVPHLFLGDTISVEFKNFMAFNFSIDNVTYSNDGGSDRIKVMLDGLELGYFDTHSDSNWGEKWNDFFGTLEIGDWETVLPGRHTISFTVEQSEDCYGVELGTLYATVDIQVDDRTFWKNPKYRLAKRRHECVTNQKLQQQTSGIASFISSTLTPPLSTHVPRHEHTTTEIIKNHTSSTDSVPQTDSAISMTTTKALMATKQIPTISPIQSGSFNIAPDVKKIFLEQLSFETVCIDKRNVRITIKQNGLAGTRIIAHASEKINKYLTLEKDHFKGISTCGLDTWQLGNIDGDNIEFQHFVPHDIVSFKLKNDKHDTAKFPAKILPFVTPIIKITFEVKTDIQLQDTSALFVLGLVNLTRETFVGLQYNSGPMDTDFLTFSPKRQIMGWSIPDLRQGTNHFYLHFDTSVNTIMFDFLKLEVRRRDRRKIGVIIANSSHIKIKGILSPTKNGMFVTTGKVKPVMNVEKVVIFYRPQNALQFHAVLSITSSGAICLYHKNEYGVKRSQSARQLNDVSQFSFGDGAGQIDVDSNISSLNLNTNTFVLTVIYNDGSILISQLIPSETSTELLVKSFHTFNKKMQPMKSQTITFQSTYINENLAAINDISDGERTVDVMRNISSLKVRDKIVLSKTSPTNVFLTSERLEIIFRT